MTEISIIVQIRERYADGTAGACAIGVSRIHAAGESATPNKWWRNRFDEACRRACTDRRRQIEENAQKPAPTQAIIPYDLMEITKKGVPRKGEKQ